ncbi:MAG: epoxyqueuosine reductase [Dehalococcoidia bacterium]
MMANVPPAFNQDPARFIADFIKSFVRDNPENRLTHIDGSPIWDEPLVGFARGDDPLFQEYKQVIGSFHLTPREVMERALAERPGAPEPGGSLSVICWVLPAAEKTRRSNRRQKESPSKQWAHTRMYGEMLNARVRQEVAGLLEGLGYAAVAPFTTSFFQRVDLPNGPASNWSERHALYAAGLGTFSLTDGFITPKGMAMRCGSVVTTLELPPTPRQYAHHYANCPFYVDGSCGACITRCPAQAITEKGHDKLKCQAYLRRISAELQAKYQVTTAVGCGLCQTAVPCESRIPKIKAAAAPVPPPA